MSIDYIMIGSNDLARSRAFYDAVMPHIGGNKMSFVLAGTLAQEGSV